MEIICLDTNILIEHKRAKYKDKTLFYELAIKGHSFAVTAITVYELMRGDNSDEDLFWKSFFTKVKILDFDFNSAEIAGKLYLELKTKGNLIDIQDLLIAAIAISHNMKLATGNKKHFARIKRLELLDI